MSYQVLARKWRPKRFDDVVGQQAVTRTLQNALSSGRLAHAFVFAGPRGVGKTTTARILACALNCEKAQSAEPCGVCDACVEIAEGRDMDVLEIDAATHTGVDNVREVIIEGLDIRPARDRNKIFIIDEVHQLSSGSFNALLKSIEEPPPHVYFMMATTEIHKIPETVLSRSQVYEFRTIGIAAIVDQLRRIAEAEGLAVTDEALHLVARDADGSMRDAQSKLDQVLAFTGSTIGVDDVSTVLGLVGRDLLLNVMQAVASEDAAAAFGLAGHAVEMGYDLRLVCRELSRVVRDLLVVSVDPSRVADPEIASDTDRDRLVALAGQFSREDLLRSFDLLTRAEFDIRGAAQPRYHLEMALLRWIYLRKLVPIEDLIQSAGAAPLGAGGSTRQVPTPARPAAAATPSAPGARPIAPSSSSRSAPARTAPVASLAQPGGSRGASAASSPSPSLLAASAPAATPPRPQEPVSGTALKDLFLADVRGSNPVLYNTLVVQAQRIDVESDRLVLAFTATQKIGPTFDKYRPVLEATATRLAGRKMTVVLETGQPPAGEAAAGTSANDEKKSALRERAMAEPGVQALLEVFPAEIRDVEEM